MPNVVFTNDRMLAWDDAALRVALDGNCNSGSVQEYRPKVHETGNKVRGAVREEVGQIIAVIKE